jgi:hypothetical protein
LSTPRMWGCGTGVDNLITRREERMPMQQACGPARGPGQQ